MNNNQYHYTILQDIDNVHELKEGEKTFQGVFGHYTKSFIFSFIERMKKIVSGPMPGSFSLRCFHILDR